MIRQPTGKNRAPRLRARPWSVVGKRQRVAFLISLNPDLRISESEWPSVASIPRGTLAIASRSRADSESTVEFIDQTAIRDDQISI
jgi:hypothetical protein